MCGSNPAMRRSPRPRCCAGPRRRHGKDSTEAGRKKLEENYDARSPLALVIATAAAITTIAPAGAADLLKLTVGQRGNWDTSISYLGEKAGIFKKHGIDLEIIYTSGSGETLQPVIAGSVDLGFAVGTQGAMAAYAKGAPGSHHRRGRRPAPPTTGTPRCPRRSKRCRTPTAAPSPIRPTARRLKVSSAPSLTSSSSPPSRWRPATRR